MNLNNQTFCVGSPFVANISQSASKHLPDHYQTHCSQDCSWHNCIIDLITQCTLLSDNYLLQWLLCRQGKSQFSYETKRYQKKVNLPEKKRKVNEQKKSKK